jgi:hypothetical protein
MVERVRVLESENQVLHDQNEAYQIETERLREEVATKTNQGNATHALP